MKKDQIYSTPQATIEPFVFDKQVADVFDDMISRSTPHYHGLQELIAQFAGLYYQPNTALYDLGCSTGETLFRIAKHIPQASPLIGVDNSGAMIHRAQQKCKGLSSIRFIESDIQATSLSTSSVVILTYILQFLPVSERQTLLTSIYKALCPKGILIMSEKIKIPDLQSEFTTLHEDYKKNQHYSELEIRQKREALENVLVVLSADENISLLKKAGFTTVQPFFQYLNFAGFIAIKS